MASAKKIMKVNDNNNDDSSIKWTNTMLNNLVVEWGNNECLFKLGNKSYHDRDERSEAWQLIASATGVDSMFTFQFSSVFDYIELIIYLIFRRFQLRCVCSFEVLFWDVWVYP